MCFFPLPDGGIGEYCWEAGGLLEEVIVVGVKKKRGGKLLFFVGIVVSCQ